MVIKLIAMTPEDEAERGKSRRAPSKFWQRAVDAMKRLLPRRRPRLAIGDSPFATRD